MWLEKANIVRSMRSHYETINDFLINNPWDEDFLKALIVLENDFRNYLLESLKSKKDSSDPLCSEYWKFYMKWWPSARIVEEWISETVFNKKFSIDSLLSDCYHRLYEIFDSVDSFESALKEWLIKSSKLNKPILPPDDLPTLEIWSGNWFEREKSTKKTFSLLISVFRNMWIYTNDFFVLYSDDVKTNMMRQFPYYGFFIPKVDKTVFFNPWYGEATFVCDGYIPADVIVNCWKINLQDKFWATKIKFFEKDIQSWTDTLKSVLSWQKWIKSKALSASELAHIKSSVDKDVLLQNIVDFYNNHKNDSIKIDENSTITVENIFSSHFNYLSYYKYLVDEYNIDFPWDIQKYFNIKWNDFKMKLWISNVHEYWNFSSSDEIIKFYKDNKKKDKKVVLLFSSYSNYKSVDKEYFKKTYNINLPIDIDETLYKIFWVTNFPELQAKLWILGRVLNSKDSIINFYAEHESDQLVKDLFDKYDSYEDILPVVNEKYEVTLPSIKVLKRIFWTKPEGSKRTINARWNDIKKALGITKLSLRWELPSKDEIIIFYNEHKSDPNVVACFYSTENYRKYYKSINELYSFNLPWSTWYDWLRKIFDVDNWNDIQKALWIPVTRRSNLSSSSEIIEFYKLFSDDPVLCKLFSSTANYQKLVREVNGSNKYRIIVGNWENSDWINDENNIVILQLPVNPKDLREKFGVPSWDELREMLWIVK